MAVNFLSLLILKTKAKLFYLLIYLKIIMKYKKYILIVGMLLLLLGGYFIADKLLFSGVKPRAIDGSGFQANFFAKESIKNSPTVILVGGGQWGDYWGQQFAQQGLVGLSLPYIGKEGLPELPEEIELTYFENVLTWLKAQTEVNPNKIVVMGASRNAELALVLASVFPKHIRGVVAYAPSAVSWSNTVLPYNSNEIKASWKYKGIDIPYLPMDKIKGNKTSKIEMEGYWLDGLAKKDLLQKAMIKVEKINGPILLFSGRDDKVWPSSVMADLIEKRLAEHDFEHAFLNIKYDNAGHLIANNPEHKERLRAGRVNIDGKEYAYEFGGTEDGDFKAKQEAKIKLMEFIDKL